MSLTIHVRFKPAMTEAEVSASVLVSEAANSAGLSLHLPCGGRGACGKCKVRIASGQVSQPTPEELAALEQDELARGYRLACQARLESDAVVEIPAESEVVGTKTLRGDDLRPVALCPNVRQVALELPRPDLSDQRSDLERLAAALGPMGAELRVSLPALRKLSGVLRDGEFRVVASLVGKRLADVHAKATAPPTLGAAVDIGTTTVVAYIVDLLTGQQLATAAAYNEQGRRGADVISRIEYCNSNPDGLQELRELVLDTVNGVIAEAAAKCHCSTDQVYEVTVVGNTTMNHLFVGLHPRYLAQAPYVAVHSRGLELSPLEAGLQMHPGGSVFCLPPIAGFVGADTVGVILATDMTRRQRPVLAVDIGTNGEVVLWSGQRLLVTSCAMGPAMEGAQIERGMRAAPGAISAVGLSNGDVTYRTIADMPAIGICGSGVVDAIATMLDLGILDSSGRFTDGDLSSKLAPNIVRRLMGEGRERRFALSDPDSEDPVCVSQGDVRQMQLAKGALRAAVDLLLDFAGLVPGDLEEVLLAGAFGNYISPRSALRMGMLPPIALEKIRGVGNAAGAGALLALLSTAERQRAVELAAAAEHIELSRRPAFQTAFMESMMFP